MSANASEDRGRYAHLASQVSVHGVQHLSMEVQGRNGTWWLRIDGGRWGATLFADSREDAERLLREARGVERASDYGGAALRSILATIEREALEGEEATANLRWRVVLRAAQEARALLGEEVKP